VIVEDGTWLLYKGVRAKEDYFYFEKKIAEVQSLADKTKNMGEHEAYEELLKEKKKVAREIKEKISSLVQELCFPLNKRVARAKRFNYILRLPF